MAYTIGASHGPFSGSGSFVVAKPSGIRTVVTGIPSFTGHDGSSPRRYFKLGRFTMGNSDGFQFSHGLEYAQQLLYPMPPVWELLAYDIKDGASCLFQELIDVPDLSLKQPWDRTPVPVFQGSVIQAVASVSTTILWTYTVPVGRKLYVSSARVIVRNDLTHSAMGYAYVQIAVDGTPLAAAMISDLAAGASFRDELAGGPLILNAFQVVSASWAASFTGGECSVSANLAGFVFDV